MPELLCDSELGSVAAEVRFPRGDCQALQR